VKNCKNRVKTGLMPVPSKVFPTMVDI